MIKISKTAPLAGTEDLAIRLADEARHIVRRYFRTRPEVTNKQDASPVTIADREIELMMRDQISMCFPDHGIRGEEFPHHQPEADWCWHLDPVDGTKSFLSGSLCFGTQIALSYLGKPILGLIDQPITEERWLSHSGSKTQMNGEVAKTSSCTVLGEAVMYTSDPFLFVGKQVEKFEAMRNSVLLTRYSHDCYAAGLLAIGQIDILLESSVYAYDIAAQIPVIEGAGGVVTDWAGNIPQLEKKGDFLAAATADLHAQALATLKA